MNQKQAERIIQQYLGNKKVYLEQKLYFKRGGWVIQNNSTIKYDVSLNVGGYGYNSLQNAVNRILSYSCLKNLKSKSKERKQ